MKKSILVAAAFALLFAGIASADQHGRNHDARTSYNIGFQADVTDDQNHAASALRKENPGLLVRFDRMTGVARSLSNPTGYLSPASLTKMGAPADPPGRAIAFAKQNQRLLGLTDDDLSGFRVSDVVHSNVTGASHIYLQQEFRGIPAYNCQLQVNLNRDGRAMGMSNAFIPDLRNSVNTHRPAVGAAAAVRALADHLGIDAGAITLVQRRGQNVTLSAPAVSQDDIEARLNWLMIRQGETRLVWNFQARVPGDQQWLDVNVDAIDATLWTAFDWVNSGTYRVYAEPDESPLHGSQARSLVVNPENGSTWFTGGTMSGNNVTACPDTDGNNSCDSNPQCSGTTCDFPVNLNNAPSTYIPAATANLFYWNNLIHDTQYLYGFDEAGGNFQENNFGLGGSGGDSVNADAQDGSGNCNANFATPTDGGNPRMQMFTCTNANPARDGDFDNGVIVHEYGHGISIRQVGGPGNSSCLNNTQQMGEGISDLFGLIYTAEAGDAGTDTRGIGSYLFALAPVGGTIRDLPYSTDNAVNNWTYESIATAGIPHGVGSRWAQAAWEVYWALVNKHGFDADLQNSGANAGNHRAMLYFNEGLKNTACGPTFLDARDGIIQAANDNNGGADTCDIWQAFADFGLGVDASTAGPGSRSATNGFALPAECGGAPPPPPPPPPPPGGCPAGWTTWTGTATAPGENFVTTTFAGVGQTCNATLSCDGGESGSDLDLYIDGESCDFFGCVWNALAGSTSPQCAEAINGTCNSGNFRWRVNVFSLVQAEPFTICTSPGAP